MLSIFDIKAMLASAAALSISNYSLLIYYIHTT
jgi:hypothetical protein